ncbi:MAG: tRNA dihydrouridine synthase DusB [Pseudomonadota bacterium]
MLSIGPYQLRNNVALAPMAGVTDLPFRRLCARFGAGLLVGEMIHSDPKLRQSTKSILRRRFDLAEGSIGPRSVQLVGNEPLLMAEAARFNVAAGAQVIDINMGCPAKKVCKKAAGSALLADEKLVKEILVAVVAAVPVPVTLKIRTGTEPSKRNGPSIARIAEDAGIALLSVHGRTRACAFRGEAEHDTTARIVEAVNIPVLANGDIDSANQAVKVLQHTGAAGVMIGRAAQGAPWLLGLIANRIQGKACIEPELRIQHQILREHVRELHRFYGDYLGARIARKHVGWCFSRLGDYEEVRRGFNTLENPNDQVLFLDDVFNELDRQELAA